MKATMPNLSDYSLLVPARCTNCGIWLPESSPAEEYANWIVVKCADCGHCSPFQVGERKSR